jgi:hypothetical protein
MSASGSGTKAGGIACRDTNYKKYGRDFYKRIGKEGGKNGHTGGFASTEMGEDGLTGRDRASIVGRVGGSKSSRKGIRSHYGLPRWDEYKQWCEANFRKPRVKFYQQWANGEFDGK